MSCHAVQETAFKITVEIYDNIFVVRSIVCRAKYSKIKIGGMFTVALVRQFMTHLRHVRNVLQAL